MKFRSRVKKLVIATGMLLMLGLGVATTAYAAEPATQQQAIQQSDRWEGTDDTWKVRTADNSGYLGCVKLTVYQSTDNSTHPALYIKQKNRQYCDCLEKIGRK